MGDTEITVEEVDAIERDILEYVRNAPHYNECKPRIKACFAAARKGIEAKAEIARLTQKLKEAEDFIRSDVPCVITSGEDDITPETVAAIQQEADKFLGYETFEQISPKNEAPTSGGVSASDTVAAMKAQGVSFVTQPETPAPSPIIDHDPDCAYHFGSVCDCGDDESQFIEGVTDAEPSGDVEEKLASRLERWAFPNQTSLDGDLIEAAATIRRLVSEIDNWKVLAGDRNGVVVKQSDKISAMREALEPFAAAVDWMERAEQSGYELRRSAVTFIADQGLFSTHFTISLDNFRKARAALQREEG